MVAGSRVGESSAGQVTALCAVFFVLTLGILLLRFWSRISGVAGRLGGDDFVISASFACTLVVQILMMVACHRYSLGRHVKHLSHGHKLMASKLFYIAQIFCNVTINLTKLSVLLLYLRVFVQRWFRISCYVLMGTIAAYTVVAVAASIWQCNPVEGAWDKSVRPRCVSLTKAWCADGVISIATDVLILALPAQPIWESRWPVKQKRALAVVFALGVCVTISAIMRAIALGFSTRTRSIHDITSILWIMAEENAAIICACLPTCGPVLRFIFPNMFTGGPAPGGHRRAAVPERLLRLQSNGEWHPYYGPDIREGHNRSIAQYHAGENGSHELILASLDTHGVSGPHVRIWKTTHYEISYEILERAER